jgi:hypothetical protein
VRSGSLIITGSPARKNPPQIRSACRQYAEKEHKMNKKFVVLTTVLTLIATLMIVSPVQAQVDLPYTTNLLVSARGQAQDVGDLTVEANGTVSFLIDESASDWRLSETTVYVSDTPSIRGMWGNRVYRHSRLNGTVSDYYVIDLTAMDRNGDGIVYISAQAELAQPTTARNPRSRRPIITMSNRTTAWAEGEESMGRRNMGSFFAVNVTQEPTNVGGPIG